MRGNQPTRALIDPIACLHGGTEAHTQSEFREVQISHMESSTNQTSKKTQQLSIRVYSFAGDHTISTRTVRHLGRGLHLIK